MFNVVGIDPSHDEDLAVHQKNCSVLIALGLHISSAVNVPFAGSKISAVERSLSPSIPPTVVRLSRTDSSVHSRITVVLVRSTHPQTRRAVSVTSSSLAH